MIYNVSHIIEGIDCGDLVDPVNGRVNISPDTKLGSVAIHKCRIGYKLKGNERRYCLANSKWSSTAPSCESTLTHVV